MSFILETKLNVPQLSQKLVPRPHLCAKLNSDSLRKMTIISAPAGYGKTTTICEWLQQIKHPYSWFSIDDGDNNPTRFFSYLIASLQKIQSNLGSKVLKLVQTQSISFCNEYVLGTLINELCNLKKTIVIVLDDYHLITHSEIHSGMSFLIEHMSDNIHIVMGTRSDPPFMLARLRSQHQITELRAKDLCFSTQESLTLFNQKMNLSISENDNIKLNIRIEGWAAGLQLAGITLKGRTDVSNFVSEFSGSNKYIMDYLLEEVFQNQTKEVQDFLLQTSILNKLNSQLCNTVIEKNNSLEILEWLECQNLFLIALDNQREWFRYHHLFGKLLQKRLQQQCPDIIKNLHLNAGKGYTQLGLYEDAIKHYLIVNDYSNAEALISQIADKYWQQGEQNTILNWMDKFPQNWKLSDPLLILLFATITFLDGRYIEAANYLNMFKNGDAFENNDQLKGIYYAISSYLANYHGKSNETMRYAENALNILSDKYAIWRCLAAMALGDLYVQKANLHSATTYYESAIESSCLSGNNYCISLAKHRLVVMYHRRGNLLKAIQLVKEYLPEDNNINMSSGALFLIYGELLYEQNQLQKAKDKINKSLKLCRYQRHAAAIPYCFIQLARIHLAIGDEKSALKETDNSMSSLKQSDMPPWVEGFVYAWKIKFHLYRKEINIVKDLIKQRNLTVNGKFTYPNVSEYLVFARFLMIQNKTERAKELLKRLNEHLVNNGWTTLALEAQLVNSILYFNTGEESRSLELLLPALEFGYSHDYRRIFYDEGEALYELLQYAAEHTTNNNFITTILEEMNDNIYINHSRELVAKNIESLSKRERQVLKRLNSHLTNIEIADDLYISLNTVKTHIKNIYNKLNVHDRQKAVETAKRFNII